MEPKIFILVIILWISTFAVGLENEDLENNTIDSPEKINLEIIPDQEAAETSPQIDTVAIDGSTTTGILDPLDDSTTEIVTTELTSDNATMIITIEEVTTDPTTRNPSAIITTSTTESTKATTIEKITKNQPTKFQPITILGYELLKTNEETTTTSTATQSSTTESTMATPLYDLDEFKNHDDQHLKIDCPEQEVPQKGSPVIWPIYILGPQSPPTQSYYNPQQTYPGLIPQQPIPIVFGAPNPPLGYPQNIYPAPNPLQIPFIPQQPNGYQTPWVNPQVYQPSSLPGRPSAGLRQEPEIPLQLLYQLLPQLPKNK